MTLSPEQSIRDRIITEDDRTGLSIPTLRRAIADNLRYLQAKTPATASINDYYLALAYTVRDRLLKKFSIPMTNTIRAKNFVCNNNTSLSPVRFRT